ncbi:MAG: hypothetical protein E6G28_01605 [Actinobacteria bacterium]|nr:MAG: hypothetical protein E6G28_01605 [Actinomycetota bacterium]
MISCPSCGQENPEGFRLCGMCGAPLAVAAPAQREERKVVTVLFCDLVGFTQRAEQLDPEDVRAILAPYHGRLRSELERHGGTVEKFIGDAVMALFGAPVAHEDDPERAVRAALAIRDFALDGFRRRRQHGRPPSVSRTRQRHPRRRDDLPRHPPGSRLLRGSCRPGEGQSRADPRLGGARSAIALRCRRHPPRAHRARRP